MVHADSAYVHLKVCECILHKECEHLCEGISFQMAVNMSLKSLKSLMKFSPKKLFFSSQEYAESAFYTMNLINRIIYCSLVVFFIEIQCSALSFLLQIFFVGRCS